MGLVTGLTDTNGRSNATFLESALRLPTKPQEHHRFTPADLGVTQGSAYDTCSHFMPSLVLSFPFNLFSLKRDFQLP